MPDVRKLMRDGASFENAYLGHMASGTVITHNVITSEQLPRDMGWADEGVCDAPPSVCVGGVPGSFELRH